MNKNGGDDILTIWWWLVAGIVAVAIFIMVTIYASKPIDIRNIESALLTEKILDCISEDGKILSDVSIFDIDSCVNLGTEYSEKQFFVKIQELKADCKEDCLISEKISGRSDFEIYCEKEYGGKVPVCKEISLLLSKNGVNEILKIKTVIGKVDKNVL
ncbi:hypothetical protein COV15_02615 [Candidatus Woesearchaeota archaeon CG10_big_fil_rev_8_21_14_0_10_34_12]|nr:MAG: hypothetical protein COV15_02615 [Candidatus Woesearchaeota archaeon CG10_big_fil_rev_8_21_14_0_10_34_12]